MSYLCIQAPNGRSAISSGCNPAHSHEWPDGQSKWKAVSTRVRVILGTLA